MAGDFDAHVALECQQRGDLAWSWCADEAQRLQKAMATRLSTELKRQRVTSTFNDRHRRRLRSRMTELLTAACGYAAVAKALRSSRVREHERTPAWVASLRSRMAAELQNSGMDPTTYLTMTLNEVRPRERLRGVGKRKRRGPLRSIKVKPAVSGITVRDGGEDPT